MLKRLGCGTWPQSTDRIGWSEHPASHSTFGGSTPNKHLTSFIIDECLNWYDKMDNWSCIQFCPRERRTEPLYARIKNCFFQKKTVSQIIGLVCIHVLLLAPKRVTLKMMVGSVCQPLWRPPHRAYYRKQQGSERISIPQSKHLVCQGILWYPKWCMCELSSWELEIWLNWGERLMKSQVVKPMNRAGRNKAE
jgi:hypothetical protein